MHFHETNRHKAQKGGHVFSIGSLGRLYDRVDFGPIVDYLVDPLAFYVVGPTPAVLKLCTGGEAVRCGVEVPALVEGRVRGDEVNGLGVHATEDWQVVPVIEGAVAKVRMRHDVMGSFHWRAFEGLSYFGKPYSLCTTASLP